MKEIWKNIPDYEGLYQVSNLGNVKSLNYGRTKKEKLLKLIVDGKGYLNVNLCKNKIPKKFLVHRLLMLTFNPEQNFEGAQVNHIDGNTSNTNLDNLEWCTQNHNMKHAYNNGLKISLKGEKNGKSKLTEIQVRKIRTDYENKCFTKSELAKMFNVKQNAISKIINNKRWNHI